MSDEPLWLDGERTFRFDVGEGLASHRLVVREDGRIYLPDHTAAERRRHEDFAALGGEPCPCVAALRNWRRAARTELADDRLLTEEMRQLHAIVVQEAPARRAWRRFLAGTRPEGTVRLPSGVAAEGLRSPRPARQAALDVGTELARLGLTCHVCGYELRLVGAGSRDEDSYRFEAQFGRVGCGNDETGFYVCGPDGRSFPAKELARAIGLQYFLHYLEEDEEAQQGSVEDYVTNGLVNGLKVSYNRHRLALELAAPTPEMARLVARAVDRWARYSQRKEARNDAEGR
jgi:hypothetical protein